jgi:hypothetical protein
MAKTTASAEGAIHRPGLKWSKRFNPKHNIMMTRLKD